MRTIRNIVLLSTVLSSLVSYGQTDFAVLRLTETPLFMDTDTLTEANLNDAEIATLLVLAEKCVQKWNIERPIKYAGGNRKERKLNDYYRQYLPAYGGSGDKFVWINLVRKLEVKKLPHKLYVSADNEHYSNCWVDLDNGVILN